MKILTILWILLSHNFFNIVSCLVEEHPILRNISTINYNKDEFHLPKTDSNFTEDHITPRLFRRQNGPKNVQHCFNLSKGKTIPEIVTNEKFNRLVVYFYFPKNKGNRNSKIMFIPGIKKQRMIPNLPVDLEDFIFDSVNFHVNDIFSDVDSFVITKGKKGFVKNNKQWEAERPGSLNSKWGNGVQNPYDDFINSHEGSNINVDFPNDYHGVIDKRAGFEFEDSLPKSDSIKEVLEELENWKSDKNNEEHSIVTKEKQPRNTAPNDFLTFNPQDQYESEVHINSIHSEVLQKNTMLKILLNNGVTIDANGYLKDPKGQIFNLNNLYFIPIIEKNINVWPATYILNSVAIVKKNLKKIVSIIKIKSKVKLRSDIGSSQDVPKPVSYSETPKKKKGLGLGDFIKHDLLKNIFNLSYRKPFIQPKHKAGDKPCQTLGCKLAGQEIEEVLLTPRIVGGIAATASGHPIRNRGRSGHIKMM